MTPDKLISIPVAAGELIDKITILEIKSERLSDPAKLAHVREELEMLNATRRQALELSPELIDLTRQLKSVNEELWRIEDAIRLCERAKDFGPRFIELARSVYGSNDQRADVKRRISQLVGSRLIEEKSYTEYR